MAVLVCGLDLGSRSVKLVLMRDDAIIDTKLYETVPFYRTYGRQVDGQLLVDFAALGLPQPDALVATGYGRNTVHVAGAAVIAELKAHTQGAVWQTGLQDFTLLDLGGQDSKVIKVRRGRMVDFLTNDKCAASTGRYLENMAAVLGLTVAQLSQYSEHPVELSSTCAIFGESELISRMLEGYPVSELAAGVNYSIFRRIRPMLGALAEEVLVFTGGVAQSPAMVRILRRETGCQVVVPPQPQFNGAIGCCVHARHMHRGDDKCS